MKARLPAKTLGNHEWLAESSGASDPNWGPLPQRHGDLDVSLEQLKTLQPKRGFRQNLASSDADVTRSCPTLNPSAQPFPCKLRFGVPPLVRDRYSVGEHPASLRKVRLKWASV